MKRKYSDRLVYGQWHLTTVQQLGKRTPVPHELQTQEKTRNYYVAHRESLEEQIFDEKES